MQFCKKILVTALTVYKSSCGHQNVRVSQLRLRDDECKSQSQLRVRSLLTILLVDARCLEVELLSARKTPNLK